MFRFRQQVLPSQYGDGKEDRSAMSGAQVLSRHGQARPPVRQEHEVLLVRQLAQPARSPAQALVSYGTLYQRSTLLPDGCPHLS